MPRPLPVTADLIIPAAELETSFARSAGPGGQNVNKVNSKAVLRWRVVGSPSLPEGVRRRFLERYSNRVNGEGELVLASDQHREQARNLAACYDLLRQMILAVREPPRRRIKSRPTRASIERRIVSKRRSSEKKQQRRFRADE